MPTPVSRAGLLLPVVKVSNWLSLAAPEPIRLRNTVCAPLLAIRSKSLIGLSVGGSLTGRTVNLKERFALKLPSLTVNRMVAVPNWSGKGVIVTARLLPLPLITMPALATSPVLDEAPVTVREPAGVSGSETTKLIGPAVESSAMT